MNDGIRRILRDAARSLYNSLAPHLWRGVRLAHGAIVEGSARRINVGPSTVVESGAVLSTEYGGSIRIGSNCVVRRGAMLLTYGGDIAIGDNCGVGPYAVLYGHGGLTVGNNVWIAAHSVVVPANHTFGAVDKPIHSQQLVMEGITIGSDVWIGAGAKVLDGVWIGDGAVIGAGAVVVDDIMPMSINAGVPARQVGTRG